MEKKNYAMVCINFKNKDVNHIFVRRVLIEYDEYKNSNFTNTRFIEKDPYFYNRNNSHQYEFYDEGYKLVETTNILEESLLTGVLRPYHTITYHPLLRPILFSADSDEEAIKLFNAREEEK